MENINRELKNGTDQNDLDESCAFIEEALSEKDALESNIDLIDGVMPDLEHLKDHTDGS